MAANISTVSGQAEVFTARTPAWHHLGVTTAGAVKWEDAIKAAHLSWSVDKRQLLAPNHNPVDAWGVFRSDKNVFFGAVGSKYTPIQNRDVFKFLDVLVEAQDGAHYESAGALGMGERVWALVNLADCDIRIRGTDDVTKSYLLGTTTHDGTKANVYKLTSVRVVCQNILNQAMAFNDTELRVKHTAGFLGKLDAAKKALVDVKGEIKSLSNKLNFLATRKVTRENLGTVLERLFPKIKESTQQQNRARDILSLFEHNDGNAFPSERGTGVNLFNAVTEWVDHSRNVRAGNDPVDQVRAASAMFGTGDAFKSSALDNILQAMEWAPAAMAPATSNILAKMAV